MGIYTFVRQRDVAQPGSALRSGRRGRWFESSHPDFVHHSSRATVDFVHHSALQRWIVHHSLQSDGGLLITGIQQIGFPEVGSNIVHLTQQSDNTVTAWRLSFHYL